MSDITSSWQAHAFTDTASVKGKRVVLRVDFNVPIINGAIADESRINVEIPFIKELSLAGAKVILLSHFGEEGESIKPVADFLQHDLSFVSFEPSLDFDVIEKKVQSAQDGDVILLENVRMWKGETDNTPSLARSFASLGEVFINDAFSVSHREHASVVGIAQNMLSFFGPTFVRELTHLTPALHPERPSLMIIGGAKIATKLPLITHYLDQGVHVFVGGAMVHDIWVAKGIDVGESLKSGAVHLPERIINHSLLLTPSDVVLASGETVPFNKIPSHGVVVDCGEATIATLKTLIEKSKTVIINGPLGLYEEGWRYGTEQVLFATTQSKATSYLGGGDTVTVAHALGLLLKFTFVSLGGGAMLDFLANGTLPGIDAVTKAKI